MDPTQYTLVMFRTKSKSLQEEGGRSGEVEKKKCSRKLASFHDPHQSGVHVMNQKSNAHSEWKNAGTFLGRLPRISALLSDPLRWANSQREWMAPLQENCNAFTQEEKPSNGCAVIQACSHTHTSKSPTKTKHSARTPHPSTATPQEPQNTAKPQRLNISKPYRP